MEELAKQVDITSAPVEEAKGLTRREALEVAVEAHKEKPALPAGDNTKPGTSTVNPGTVATDTTSRPALEPPAEYNAQERADFATLTRTGQEAQLRLDKSRKSKLDEIRQEQGELAWARDIAREVTPFLKTNGRGDKEPVPQVIIKALKAVNQLDTGDPLQNAADYIKAKGKEVPQSLLDAIAGNKNTAPDISKHPQFVSMQERLNSVTSKIEEAERSQTTVMLGKEWHSFSQTKNAAGKLKFPDIDNTELGTKLARKIGSLVVDDTPLARDYIASVKARIPNASYQTLILEAYKYHGGRIDESAESPKQTTKEHINRSARAASSVPGRGSSTTTSGPVKKFKSTKEAIAHAVAYHKELEG